jgi:hypothetical protein
MNSMTSGGNWTPAFCCISSMVKFPNITCHAP